MTLYQKIDKCKALIDKKRPFEGFMLKQLQNYYRIGLTWSSNALEGNTLSISETKVLLEDGLTVGGHPLRELYETVGHGKAYDFMFSLMDSKKITEKDILTMHLMFYKNIDENYAGKYRDKEVFITGSKYELCRAESIQSEMNELICWAEMKRSHYHPVEFAAQLHKRFVFIHPFIDGNGRVSRLLMNMALIQDGYIPAVIPPVLRHEYITLLEKAHEADTPFSGFIAERVFESEKDMMRMLHIELPELV